MNLKCSIIIPVYKTPAKLLRECVASCAEVKDVEIICVLDSPGDACEDVLDQIAEKNERVCVLKNNVNRGVSYSRNCGLDVARGEFVTFVDADDRIDAKAYEEGLDLAENEGLDAVSVGGINEVEGLKKGEVVFGRYDDTDAEDLLKILTCVGMSSCSVLYRRKKIEGHKIRFDESLSNNEDFVFFTTCVMSGFRLGLYYAGGYIQVGHSESATRSAPSPRQFLSCVKAANKVLSIIKGKELAIPTLCFYERKVRWEMFQNILLFSTVEGSDRDWYCKDLSSAARLYVDVFSPILYLPMRLIMQVLKYVPKMYFVRPWPIARFVWHFPKALTRI